MPTTSSEQSVLAAIDRDGLVEAVQRLVRIESWSGRESPAQRLMAELMTDAGLSVDEWRIDLAEVQAHPACSYEIEREEALGVVGSLEGSRDGPVLLLNGHVDVVPPGDPGLWTHPPFDAHISDGRIYGRGALDMKGPLLAGLFALRAIGEAGVELGGTVRLLSVIGEEDGGIGTLATILRGYSGDGAIVMEPTGLAVVPVQAGCQNFRVRVSGLAAHGAIREEGVSAFERLFHVYRGIEALEAERNARLTGDPLYERYRLPFPISIGTMSGGDWASSVPDHAVMEGRMGVMPSEDMAAARLELEAAVAETAVSDEWLQEHPPIVEWWGGRFLPSQTALDDPITVALRESIEAVLDEPPRVEGVTFGADAGLLTNVAHTPTVLFGAGDLRMAHRPDEFVDIEELVQMTRVLAVTALRFCGRS